MKYKTTILFIIILATTTKLQAGTGDSLATRYNFIKIQIQYAGNLGMISAGIGQSFLNDAMDLYFIYGYLPEIDEGHQVHTLALKSTFRLGLMNISPDLSTNCYAGFAVLYGITNNTYLNYPSYFPKDYYNSNAIHASLILGMRLNLEDPVSCLRKVSFYTELGTLDYYIWSAIKTKSVSIMRIWNLSLGITLSL